MAQLGRLIQEEQLLGMQWDTQHINNVLGEILKLFQDQSNRISRIEEKLPSFAEKVFVEKFKSDFEDFENQTAGKLAKIDKTILYNQESVDHEIKQLKSYIDSENLSCLAESRRLVTNEIANYVPKINETDPVIVSLQESIAENLEKIKKLTQEFDAATIPYVSTTLKSPEEAASIRVTQCEKRIHDIELRLQTYPNIEADLSTLQIQLPAMTRRLEKKINELTEKVDKSLSSKSYDQFPPSSPEFKSSSQLFKNEPPAGLPPPIPTDKKLSQQVGSGNSSALSSFVRPDPKEAPAFELQFGNLEESLPKVMEVPQVTDLPDLPPPPSKSTEDALKISAPPVEVSIDEIPSHSDAQMNFREDNYQLAPIQAEPIVKVYETHTHVSELNSSVRVVTELEWCTKAINQHHEAIRQLQQGLRTQQENFDTITENLMRVNTTHNTRISQLAQQQLHQMQDSDDLKRQLTEQLNALQQQIIKSHRTQIIEQAQIDTSGDLNGTGRSSSEMTSVLSKRDSSPRQSGRKKVTLPPLQQQAAVVRTTKTSYLPMPSPILVNDNEVDEDPLLSTDRTSSRSVKKEEKTPEKDDNEENKPKPSKKKFTFSTTHFSANVQECRAQVLIAELNTKPVEDDKPKNRLDNIEIYSYVAPSTHPYNMGMNRQPTTTHDTNDRNDELPDLTPSEFYKKPAPVVNGDVINFGNRTVQIRQNSQDGFNWGQDMNNMIEDKVSMIARKAVTILADKAKSDMKEQANEMKKTVDSIVTLVDNKIDREFVERMFNKFRVMLNDMNEKLENLQCSFLEWVTRDELEMVLQKFVNIVADVKDTAATKTKYNCLLCGRPRQHLAGMMVKPERSEISSRASLGGPTTAVKPSRQLTAMPKDDSSSNGKRSQTSQAPRDVVQFLTFS